MTTRRNAASHGETRTLTSDSADRAQTATVLTDRDLETVAGGGGRVGGGGDISR